MTTNAPYDDAPAGRSLILHVGLPKCGSTAIQHFLCQHSTAAKLTYLNHPDEQDIQSRFLYKIFAQSGMRFQPDERRVALEWLSNQITNGENTIIASDEVLSQIDYVDCEAMIEFLRRADRSRKIVVLIYVRPYFDWLESLINQVVKRGNFRFDGFSTNDLQGIGRFPTEIWDVARTYESLADALHVAPYPSDIVEGFAGWMGLDQTTLAPASLRPNKSPSNGTAIAEFARLRESPGLDRFKEARATFLSRAQVEHLWEQKQPSLHAFAKTYGLPVEVVDDVQPFLGRASHNGLIDQVAEVLSRPPAEL